MRRSFLATARGQRETLWSRELPLNPEAVFFQSQLSEVLSRWCLHCRWNGEYSSQLQRRIHVSSVSRSHTQDVPHLSPPFANNVVVIFLLIILVLHNKSSSSYPASNYGKLQLLMDLYLWVANFNFLPCSLVSTLSWKWQKPNSIWLKQKGKFLTSVNGKSWGGLASGMAGSRH